MTLNNNLKCILFSSALTHEDTDTNTDTLTPGSGGRVPSQKAPAENVVSNPAAKNENRISQNDDIFIRADTIRRSKGRKESNKSTEDNGEILMRADTIRRKPSKKDEEKPHLKSADNPVEDRNGRSVNKPGKQKLSLLFRDGQGTGRKSSSRSRDKFNQL